MTSGQSSGRRRPSGKNPAQPSLPGKRCSPYQQRLLGGLTFGGQCDPLGERGVSGGPGVVVVEVFSHLFGVSCVCYSGWMAAAGRDDRLDR